MSNIELEKVYDPIKVEEKIYGEWLDKKYFHAVLDDNKEPFTIVIPPPNITGQLHMGHALDNTLQDIIIRFKRMQGFSALWLPGTDHASIATEAKIVEAMEKEGLTKEMLGRDAFLEKAWEWKKLYGSRIVEQLKKLGSSCDWERERFTMDEGLSEAVKEVFIRLYNKGLIYRGERIINWCPRCATSISDAEVEYEEKEGSFWHIKYPIKDENVYIVIATTRPETMLGDTAVAVHPEDERYSTLIGKTVILPLVNREIPIIADDFVDKDFGTGAVKITPAHDPNDFEVGLRHDLPTVKVIGDDAHMTGLAGVYAGMDRYEAREAVVKDLENLDLLMKKEKHIHNVGECYRCRTTIEPMVSNQWFVKMKPLADPAIDAVKEGLTTFIPERFSKIYFNWMENIQDWCISRQLWWGHRIPAYYCKKCGEITVSHSFPEKCSKCSHTELIQDEDTLDTWFSSALWPFSTLGWPENTPDLKYFYPTDVLVTGYDIIFFWVARMIFSGIEHMGEVPFKHVFIHGIVRDSQGRKMSKSLGNGIDPLEVIDEFGTDALRFALIMGISPGNDLRYSTEKTEAGRNFTNKIWNAARFVLMNFNVEEPVFDINFDRLETTDKWILSKLNSLTKDITENMEKFELGIALGKVYEFIWEQFCDWYIEMVKPRLYNSDHPTRKEAIYVLNKVLSDSMKLLHPFMPFVTEKIFLSLIVEDESIMISKWPEFNNDFSYPDDEVEIEVIMECIRSIRNIRSNLNVAPSKKAGVIFVTTDKNKKRMLFDNKALFEKLAYASSVTIEETKVNVPQNSSGAVLPEIELYMPLEELVNIEEELDRLNKEKDHLMKELERVNGKLSNKGFINKAPEKVVDEEKNKKIKYEQMFETVVKRIESLK